MIANYSTKDLILAITSMPNKSRELLKTNPDYSPLLEVIINSFDYYNHEHDDRLLTIKELSEKSGIAYGKLKKLIQRIYFDLIERDSETSPFFNHPKQEVEFYLEGYYEDRCSFKTELTNIPRKGESIEVDFFKPLLGTSYFYVNGVNHRFEDGKHVIVLFLKNGNYNSYMDLRKDQGEATGELSWNDYRLTAEEVKEKLAVRKRPWG